MLFNSAGGSAGDPTLKNLGIELVVGASTMDIATLTDVWVDTNNTFPGTNSIKSSLSPAATVITAGNNGSYNDTTKEYTLGSLTGVSVGDYYYLSHGSLTPGFYKIASIVSTNVTIVGNPLNGAGNKTGISFQVAYRYNGTLGTAPFTSSSGGQINYVKVRASDSVSNQTDASDSFYIRDPLTGANLITVGTGSYTGLPTVTTTTPAFDLLPSWTNRGGVTHVELGNHSVQGVNNFKWGDNTITEKTVAAALASDFLLAGGDGAKYGKMILKSKSGAAVLYNIDMDVLLDTGGPTIIISAYGR